MTSFIKLSSLNSRIILGAITIVSSFVVLIGITLSHTFYNSAYSALKDSLTGQIYLLMADREFTPDNLNASTQLPNSKDVSHTTYTQLFAYITHKDGSILWQSAPNIKPQLPPINPLFQKNLTHGKKIFQHYEIKGKDFISLSIAIFWDLDSKKYPLIYHISDDVSRLNNKIFNYQYQLWINLIIMSLLLLISLFFILRWGLKPLREVEQEIKAVEKGLQDKLNKRYPDELIPLTYNINQLIHYERQQQQRYHNALADLAHSLKTPLAIIKGQNYTIDHADRYIDTVNNAISRMNSIIEYQLQRASSHSNTSHIQYLQIKPITELLIKTMKKIYHDKNIYFELNCQPHSQFKISEGDFMEILGNLLDNACKWCQNKIIIDIHSTDTTLQIGVIDNGSGIELDMIHKISQRGIRADELTPGHGVGLAIVQDIIAVYNGRISFINEAVGGLKVEILMRV